MNVPKLVLTAWHAARVIIGAVVLALVISDLIR